MDSGLLAPFVGRRRDLALLEAKLDEAVAGQPRVVLIEGVAGIGKSALLDRFLVQRSETQVLRASGEESELLLTYGVVDQLLRDALAAAGGAPKALRATLDDHLTVGAELLEVLGTLQEQGPVILAVDDLQWADEGSLKALLFCLRRLRADRVLTLLVTRTEEPHRVPEGLDRLSRGQGGATLEIGGFDTGELRELAALMGVIGLSGQAAQRLRDHTEGNALHVQALLTEVSVEAWGSPDLALPAPRSFGLLVLGRRAQCSEEAQRLVDSASVLGMHSSLESAGRLAGIGDPLQSLDEASGVGLLRQPHEEVGRRTIAFTHPLVHAAIYQGMGVAQRARLHARAAGLVADPASSLSHRVAAALSADTGLAHELAEFAGEQAGRGAWASAAAHLVKASRLSPGRLDRERLLLEAVNWMVFSGSLSQAKAFTAEVTSFPGSALRDCILGQLALLDAKPVEAAEMLASAWKQCDTVAEAQLAATIAYWNAAHAINLLRAADAIHWARRALELTRPGSPEASRGQAVLSVSLAYSGRIAEAFTVLGPLEVTGGAELEDWALVVRGMLRLARDELQDARTDLALAAATAVRQGSLQTAADALDWLATAEYHSGAWDEAIQHAERALLIYAESERPHRDFNPSALVAVSAARGDWSRAEQYTREATTQPPGYEMVTLNVAIAHAQLAAARSDHRRVLRALEPVLGFTHRKSVYEPGILRWQDLYADALVSLGRVAEADTFLRPHESLAAEQHRQSMMARLACVRGRVDLAEGRVEDADAAFKRSLHHIEELHMPFEQARIQLAYGSSLRRLGSRRAAATQLWAAQASLIELGAEPYLARCERELAACGLAPRKRRDPDGIKLTPQEVIVARLVASGLTNREVAAELVLSTKTIEFHLGQIFDKLGITSRRQIARHLPHPAGVRP